MVERTETSPNPDPQLLSEEGGIQLKHFNPKAILRFSGRKCITCGNEILDHWIIYGKDPDLRSEYWCSKEGNQYSQGITDCSFDLNGIQAPKENNERGDK